MRICTSCALCTLRILYTLCTLIISIAVKSVISPSCRYADINAADISVAAPRNKEMVADIFLPSLADRSMMIKAGRSANPERILLI